MGLELLNGKIFKAARMDRLKCMFQFSFQLACWRGSSCPPGQIHSFVNLVECVAPAAIKDQRNREDRDQGDLDGQGRIAFGGGHDGRKKPRAPWPLPPPSRCGCRGSARSLARNTARPARRSGIPDRPCCRRPWERYSFAAAAPGQPPLRSSASPRGKPGSSGEAIR